MFRTGWDADAGLVLFRAGPTFNHNHSDQGSFQFRALGETMVTEAGWSDYYKDPYYDTFFTQAAGHNTLLVDGNPASQDIADTAQFAALNRHPSITDATLTPFYDAVGSDLAPVYSGRLESYTRRLAYLKPDYLIVFDRVRTKALPARLGSRLHVASRSGLTVNETGAAPTATYAGARAAMAVRAFSSVKSRFTAGDGHIPYPVFSARTPLRPSRRSRPISISSPSHRVDERLGHGRARAREQHRGGKRIGGKVDVRLRRPGGPGCGHSAMAPATSCCSGRTPRYP